MTYVPKNSEVVLKVKSVLIDALALDDDEVTLDARITKDLGAESIDFLDITFKLEQSFGVRRLYPFGGDPSKKWGDIVASRFSGPLNERDLKIIRKEGAHFYDTLPAAHRKALDLTRESQYLYEGITVRGLVRYMEEQLPKFTAIPSS